MLFHRTFTIKISNCYKELNRCESKEIKLSCYSLYFHILELNIKMSHMKKDSDDDVDGERRKRNAKVKM